ncbi:MAG: 16S rRNA (cytosine(1402)-N(4))-methyltransferase RsmH [Streptomycetales bacterium]
MNDASHVPVMLERCVGLLTPALEQPGAVFVDATLGLGGHSEAILRRFSTVRLLGLDRDPEALTLAADRLARHVERVTLVHAGYDELPDILAGQGLEHVDGVLFDLGVSSLQLDRPERGFAYARDTPLDMRMDPTRGRTAAEILNTYPGRELTRILRSYGEERFARRIADAVVRERAREPFSTSARLVDVIRSSVPAATRRTGGHPAKRTFQALRIEVNGEFPALERALPRAIHALALRGRIVVLSYHSLEDRLVKRALVARSRPTAPPDMPVVPASHEPQFRLLTRGAESPSAAEAAANPRAVSARLRAAERVRQAA